jgi:O6-methylguanine-DNA--protein-cysteine methyltransferase
MEENKPKRSLRENKAIHKYFSQVAEALTEHGRTVADLSKVFEVEDISPTGDTVKKIWKAVLEKQTGKTSTTEMISNDITEVFKEFHLKLSQMIYVDIPFPSIETQEFVKYYENYGN